MWMKKWVYFNQPPNIVNEFIGCNRDHIEKMSGGHSR